MYRDEFYVNIIVLLHALLRISVPFFFFILDKKREMLRIDALLGS